MNILWKDRLIRNTWNVGQNLKTQSYQSIFFYFTLLRCRYDQKENNCDCQKSTLTRKQMIYDVGVVNINTVPLKHWGHFFPQLGCCSTSVLLFLSTSRNRCDGIRLKTLGIFLPYIPPWSAQCEVMLSLQWLLTLKSSSSPYRQLLSMAAALITEACKPRI